MTDHRDELARLRAENARLITLLEAHGIAWQAPAPILKPSATLSLTTDEKVTLFGQLFRGRTDVYPVRWESKAGKNGYSPACANEWRPSFAAAHVGTAAAWLPGDGLANRNDGVEVLEVHRPRHLSLAFLPNYPEFPDSCLRHEFLAGEDVLQVLADGAHIHPEQFGHQFLRQPQGFVLIACFDALRRLGQ